MLAILNFLKDINFTDQNVCKPGIQLHFETFPINTLKTISTRSSNMKLGSFIPPYLDNNTMKKKVKQI